MTDSDGFRSGRWRRVRIVLQSKWYALPESRNRWAVVVIALVLAGGWYWVATRSARNGDLMSSPWFRMFAIADPIFGTIIALGAVATAVLAGRSDRWSRYLILGEVRHARRIVARHVIRETTGQSGQYRIISVKLAALDDIYRKLSAFSWGVLRGQELRPGDFVSVVLADTPDRSPGSTEARGRVSTTEQLELVYRMTREVLAPGHQLIIPALVYRQDVEKVRSIVQNLATLLERDYRGSVPVDVTKLEIAEKGRRFGDWVSAFMGSYILADGIASRSGVIARTVVHHRARWKSVGGEPEVPTNGGRRKREWTIADVSPHAALHGNDQQDCPAVREDVDAETKVFRPGDYDGRILSLRAVQTAKHLESGEYLVEFHTDETCYAITENDRYRKCKHLPSTPEVTVSAPRCESDQETGEIRIESSRTVLLNTAVGVISIDHAGEPTLLLAQRSGHARNATNVVSATAGGVFEHRRGSDDADCDALGVPDPLTSVIRETREELGLDIARSDMVPVAVMLANIQGRPRMKNGETDRNNGQLVATICYLTLTDMSAADIMRQRQLHADWHTGRFELSDIVGISISTPDDSSGESKKAAVDSYCRSLRRKAAELDQNAMAIALYAGAHFYGSTAMMSSIQDFFEVPWWFLPWSGESSGHRLVVDPRRLFGNRADEILAVNDEWGGWVQDVFGPAYVPVT